LPIFVLSFVGLCIYDCPNDLNARIANIAVLLLAYIAFIPTLRSLMPPVPYITMNDTIIGINLFACLLILLESYIENRDLERGNDIEYQKNIRYGFKIATCIIFCLPMLLITLLSITYYTYWQR